MHRFQTTLVPGKERPYTSSTFLIIPHALAKAWGAGQKALRGTISGTAYVAEAKRPETRLRRARTAPAGIRARAFPR